MAKKINADLKSISLTIVGISIGVALTYAFIKYVNAPSNPKHIQFANIPPVKKNAIIDNTNTTKDFTRPIMNEKSTCFSCQNQLDDSMKWKSNSTSCFSCERDMINRTNNNSSAYLAQQKENLQTSEFLWPSKGSLGYV